MCGGGVAIAAFRDKEEIQLQPALELLPGTIGSLKLPEISSFFYWMPSVTNFPGVDGVLFNPHHIFTLQASIADSHSSPAQGIKEVWKNILPALRENCSWHIVVVTKTDVTAKRLCKQFLKQLDGFHLGTKKKVVNVWACVI